MITLLSCLCHNSEPLIRRALRENHVPDWSTRPIIKGKEQCLTYLNSLEETRQIGALKQYLRRSSSWSVVLGNDRWVDIGHATIKDRLDAEIILKEDI